MVGEVGPVVAVLRAKAGTCWGGHQDVPESPPSAASGDPRPSCRWEEGERSYKTCTELGL